MKTKLLLLLALAFSASLLTAAPLGTAFTYQGKLADGGNPAQGIYDLRFTIYDAAESGTQVGTTFTNSATAVSNGLFTVTLDFGSETFTGEARWLEIGVRTNGGTAFAALTPRQPLTAAPYALHAPTAGVAATAGLAQQRGDRQRWDGGLGGGSRGFQPDCRRRHHHDQPESFRPLEHLLAIGR